MVVDLKPRQTVLTVCGGASTTIPTDLFSFQQQMRQTRSLHLELVASCRPRRVVKRKLFSHPPESERQPRTLTCLFRSTSWRKPSLPPSLGPHNEARNELARQRRKRTNGLPSAQCEIRFVSQPVLRVNAGRHQSVSGQSFCLQPQRLIHLPSQVSPSYDFFSAFSSSSSSNSNLSPFHLYFYASSASLFFEQPA